MKRTGSDPLWDRWSEVDSLFKRLLDLPPEDRDSRLIEWSAGDAELRRLLEELLHASDHGRALRQPPGQTLIREALAEAAGWSDDEEDRVLPELVGPYRVEGQLGRGGMATVYLAQRADPDFPQRVALKVLRRGVDSEDVVRRFRAERQILARLHHPNIARIFDAGTTENGRPFLVLEYVEGKNLIAHCDARGLDLHARLRLFMAVARAVSHAHAHGVVHGDLKPSNILVTEDEQHVRLLDFGIAKILSPADRGEPLTRPGARPMTPGFASPEQRLGLAVTERSDVYQLGLVLYELLTGRQPLRDRDAGAGMEDGGTGTPTSPSRVVQPDAAATRGLDAKGLSRALRGDLDAVVLHALQRDPRARYPSVQALHDDVARCLDGVPVTARRDEAARRRRRWLRRAARIGGGIGLASLLWIALFAPRGESAPAAVTPAPTRWLALAPISSPSSSDPSLQVAELLATSLARTPEVQIVELQRWGGGGGLAELSEVARMAGAEELLSGTLRTLPDGELVLEVVRTEIGSSEPPVSYRVQGADPFALVDRMTEVVLADLGYAPPARGVASVTTSSPVAFRLYEEGLRVYHRGDYRGAYRLFSAALNEDPQFAMAAYHRALLNEDIDNAAFLDDLVLAVTISEYASERERLLIRNAWALEMDEPGQAALADSLVTRFPAEPAGHLFVGLARVTAGDFLAAIPAFERARSVALALAGTGDPRCLVCDALEGTVNAYLLADSLPAAERVAREWVALRRESAPAWRMLATTLEYQGRTDEALTARNLAATFGSENPRDGVFEAVLALREGDFARADRSLAVEQGDVDPLTWQNVLWYRTLSARYQGRLEEALESAVQYREALLNAAAAGHPSLWAPLLEAVVLEEYGRPDEAARLWRQIASGPYEPGSASRTARHRAWTLTHAAGAHAKAGDVHLLDALADTIQTLGEQSAYGRDPRLHEHVRGLSLMARGDTAAAAESFQRAVYSLTGGYGRINLELGRALLALGRPQEAIPVLRGALRGPLDAANLYVNRTDLHRLLAEAYAASNLPDSAAVHAAWVRRAES